MGLRLQGDFYGYVEPGQTQEKYTLKIYDDEWSGAVSDFNIKDIGIDWLGQGKGVVNNRITPSTLRIILKVDTSTIETFLQDCIQADERRFVAELRTGVSADMEFVGYLLTDIITVEDKNLEFDAELQFIDGIGMLKTIDYNNDGSPYSGRESVLDHIYNILGKIGLESYWSGSETYFLSVNNWWEDSQTPANSKEPLHYARIDHRIWITIDDKGNNTYTSCYDVLRQICENWHGNFMLSGGKWIFRQWLEYANTGTVVIRGFQKSKTAETPISSTAFNDFRSIDGTNIKIISGGVFEYLPALARVNVRYNHFATRNLIPGSSFSHATGILERVTIDEVDNNSGAARFMFRGNLSYQVVWTDPLDFYPIYLVFRFTIRIGTKYLKRDATVSNGSISYTTPTWTTDSSDYYEYVVYNGVSQASSEYLTQIVEFSTIALPESGEVYFNFELDRTLNIAGTSVNGGTEGFTVDADLIQNYLEILLDGTPNGQYATSWYAATNSIDGNSEVIDIESLFGDGPTDNEWGHMQVTNDRTTWEFSDNWAYDGTGTNYSFSQLTALEIMRGQRTPKEVWQGTFLVVNANHRAHFWIQRTGVNGSSSNRYAFLGGTWNIHSNTWSGEWAFIGRSTGTQIESQIDLGVVKSDLIPPSGGPPPPQDDVVDTGLIGVVSNTIPSINLDNIKTGDTVTSISIGPTTDANVWSEGQIIKVINPTTNESQDFTVAANVAEGATSISVTSQSATYDFPVGSFLVPDAQQTAASINNALKPYYELFEDVAASSVTLAESVLPTDSNTIKQTVFVFRSGLKTIHTKGFSTTGTNQVNFLRNGASETLYNEDVEIYVWRT